MQDLKSLVERNIDLERQKLYKQQQYQAYQNQEIQGLFQQEATYLHNLFQDQNPVYNDFYLSAEIVDINKYQVKLSTVRKTTSSENSETEYVYRGHVVKKCASELPVSEETITNLYVTWLPDQYKWAVIRAENQQSQVVVIGDRNNLIKVFFNLTVKDIAKVLEEEANQAAQQPPQQDW